MNPKQRAALAAIRFVRDGMIVGLGTGSTADFFLQALAAEIKAGRLRTIRGVPTSSQSQRRAEELGIPLVPAGEFTRADVTIDGADEIDPHLHLIKGLGGALVREKIVAQNSDKLIIIADAGKKVPVLGSKSPLPVEVIPFAHEIQADFLRGLGAQPILRRGTGGEPFITDNGNLIYDCRFERIDDPVLLESTLRRRAGIVDTGLFIGLAHLALIADENQIMELIRS